MPSDEMVEKALDPALNAWFGVADEWDRKREDIERADLMERMRRTLRAALTAAMGETIKPLSLSDPADDEAARWVTQNLTALRRDDGTMEYTLLGVIRAYQAGKASAAMGEEKPVASGDEEAQCYSVHLAWSDEDDAWIATSPDLPGCCAVGDSRHEAVREIQDAIFAWIDAAKEAGRSIPKATLSKPPEWMRVAHPSREDVVEECAKRLEALADKAAKFVTGNAYRMHPMRAPNEELGRALADAVQRDQKFRDAAAAIRKLGERS